MPITIDDIVVFDAREVAKKLKLHHHTVLRYIRENKLYARKIGKNYTIPMESLKEFLRTGRSGPPQDPNKPQMPESRNQYP